MKREDDERLWDLLGQAAGPDISPFFARNVVRKARTQSRWPFPMPSWGGLRRLVPAAGLAAAVMATIVLSHSSWLRHGPAASEVDPVARIDPQDFEVVVDLDELLTSYENSSWDENSSL